MTDDFETLIVPRKENDLPTPGVQQARVYEGYGNAHHFADAAVAHRECSSRNKAYVVECPECAEKVVLHCDQCKLQVSGCTCTDTVIHGRDYALKARRTRPTGGTGMNRAQRRIAEREKRRSGPLWTPDQLHR